MIYITGDRHGKYAEIFDFCYLNNTDLDDIMIILGDAGINFYLDFRDTILKRELRNLPMTLFCIHGNHEERPENIKTYETKMFRDGIVYYEKKYPNILFAKDGEIYDFNGIKTMPIGGAYSIDKDIRIKNGYEWYASEQPNDEKKNRVRENLLRNNNEIDVILSHTCPYKYMPFEAFVGGVNESGVDKTTELFLDEIENNTDYKKWYCGHFHVDKEIDKMKFMMNDIEVFNQKNKTLKKR